MQDVRTVDFRDILIVGASTAALCEVEEAVTEGI